jgi:hypothetical protein
MQFYSHFILFTFPQIAQDVILEYFASPHMGPTYGLKTFGFTKNTRLTSKLEDDIYFCSLTFPKTSALNFTCVAILIATCVIRTFRSANPTSLMLG